MIDTAKLRPAQLTHRDTLTSGQYSDIARLIYETDPYIYPALFGEGPSGMDNAVQILTETLRENSDTMFSKENLFVLYQGEDIVGLILWHSGCLKWDPCEILKAARQNNIQLNHDNIEKVAREYVGSQYSNDDPFKKNTLSLINICVKKGLRSSGIGKRMLEFFMQLHAEEQMELVVLADNLPAIGLYKKFGFAIANETDGFSLTQQKPPCFVMEREP